VPDRAEITRIAADCARYWRETGVPRRAADEMRLELEQHLLEADAEGRSPERVVGADPAAFAEAWAAEYRKQGAHAAVSWQDVTSGRAAARRANSRAAWMYVAGASSLVAGVIAGTQISGGGGSVDNDIWRWFWAVLAVVAAIAEMFTAGFFLLPVSIGAIAGAILAWTGVDPIAQWLVFFGVSAIAFTYLRRFARHQDEDQPAVGANRWANARGVALSDIDPDHQKGMVRVEGEEWRATTDGELIPAGSRVVVKEVRGSKLVVAPVDQD
jgi:membrane protein implicated in regulation of membrane protease activity